MTPAQLAAQTAKWAVTMTKVRIRRAESRAAPRWHFVTFLGPNGGESRGVVDLIAVRKDHGDPALGTKRGDLLQIVLIQVKGGGAAGPTVEDGKRLRIVARRHGACRVLLASWKKGTAAKFFSLSERPRKGSSDWDEVKKLSEIFG